MSTPVVEKIRRWELAGATVHVVSRSGAGVLVELRTCTGETTEYVSSNDPELLEYLAARPGEDWPPELSTGSA